MRCCATVLKNAGRPSTRAYEDLVRLSEGVLLHILYSHIVYGNSYSLEVCEIQLHTA